MANKLHAPHFASNDIHHHRVEPGSSFHRIHGSKYKANSFNPGFGNGRFHPLVDARNNAIPTLYASDAIDGAFSEALIRDRVAGDVIYKSELVDSVLTRIELKKKLVLADLTGSHIRKLGTTRGALLECDESCYDLTAKWAEAIHTADDKVQGMCWISKQCDTTPSFVLFGDRVNEKWITVTGDALPLDHGDGLILTCEQADKAGITIVI